MAEQIVMGYELYICPFSVAWWQLTCERPLEQHKRSWNPTTELESESESSGCDCGWYSEEEGMTVLCVTPDLLYGRWEYINSHRSVDLSKVFSSLSTLVWWFLWFRLVSSITQQCSITIL